MNATETNPSRGRKPGHSKDYPLLLSTGKVIGTRKDTSAWLRLTEGSLVNQRRFLVSGARSGALAELKDTANVMFALEHLVPPKGSASDRDRCKIGSVIFRAPAERLAEFRRRVEGGAVLLGPAVEVLALAQAGQAVPTQPTGQAPCQPVAPNSDPDDTDSSDDLDYP